MIEAWGTYWLFFSGNLDDSRAYGIGVARARPRSGRVPTPTPIPSSGPTAGTGPGEQSLFHDGSNVYLLYNPFRANDPGRTFPVRWR